MTVDKRNISDDIALPILKPHDASDYPDQELKDDTQRHSFLNAESPELSESDSTATVTSDEFDWEAEDDARSIHFKAKAAATRGQAVWKYFMKLSRPIRTLIIGSIGAGILITPLLVFKLRFNSSPGRIQAHTWSLWLAVTWGAGCITYLVVDLLPGLFLFLCGLFGFKVERLKTTVELTAAVSGWLKLALDISWMWIALSVIRATYKPPGSYWTIINRVMQALFSFGILLLVEKVFLRYVAINFHRKALADRIVENKLGLKALDRLSNAQPSPSVKRNPYGNGRRGHKSKASTLDMLGFGGRSRGHETQGSSSSTIPPGEKSDVENLGKKIKTSNAERRKRKRTAVASVIVGGLGNAIGEVALKNSKFNRDGMGSLYSAGKLARKLFSTLSDVYPPRSHLIVDDFEPYFPTEEEAIAAFSLFDKDGNGDITKREMREAVRRIYRERRDLASSLKDVGSVVAILDAVMLTVTLMIFIFVCLLIFNRSNTIASLVPLATIVLGFSFIFGHSAQMIFESLIFIFSTHVFDVGDLVMIDDSPMFVREFGLFATTFQRVDGQVLVAPNSLLATSKLVHNLRRSGSMWESTTIMIAYDTPLDVIEQLRIRLQGYVSQNDHEFSNVGVNIDKMEYQNATHIIIAMEHRPNWQDWGGRWGRRTAFMRNLKTILEDLDVKYSLPIQPVLLPRGPGQRLYSSSLYSDSGSFREPPSPKRSPRSSKGRPGLSVNTKYAPSRARLHPDDGGGDGGGF
ncbi:Mechanosensitive ion channel-domain-containing protein [Abortiporus biennis]|nr:Mechanosensitive ion channel-domain-containing protein [Abortiporus biennis]